MDQKKKFGEIGKVRQAPAVVKVNKKAKSDRKAEIEGIINNIKNGTLELVSAVDGKSPVWQKFWKIQKTATKELINFVRCRECKVMFTFTGTTSSLIRHNCKETDENEDFQILSEEKLEIIQEIVMEKTITSSATDLLPIEVFWKPGHIKWAQTFVRIGEKYGSINVEESLPKINAVKRRMNEMKEQSRQFLRNEFQQAYNRGWCSLSMENCDSNGIVQKSKLLTVTIHYISNGLKGLQRKPIFTIGFDETDDTSTILEEISYNFVTFADGAFNLKTINIVTPKTELFQDILRFPYKRTDCTVTKLNNILEMIFACSFEEKEMLRNCRSIVSFIKKERTNNHLKFPIKIDSGSWESISEMISSITVQFDDVMKLVDKREGNSFIITKKRADEIISLLKPFLEALEDLKPTNYPTANKVALCWVDLNLSLKESDNQSFTMKQTMSRARSIFSSHFSLTMGNKIDCFLDPRYKWLKMFNDIERTEVYDEVRDLLRTTAESNSTNSASSSSGTTSSVNVPSEDDPPRKRSRFEKFETTMSDTGSKDEVELYLRSADAYKINFDDEFNVVTFWKLYEKKYPGLFRLATSRLNVPACSVTDGQNRFVEHKLSSGNLNDFVLIRNHFENMKNGDSDSD